MEYRLIIPGRLDSLNSYIKAERSNRYMGAKMKKENEEIILCAVSRCMRGVKIERPVFMEYLWAVPDKRTDRDNIAFARKFVQDALVKAGVLKNDGWDDVVGFSDRFEVDKEHPRIEIIIREVTG